MKVDGTSFSTDAAVLAIKAISARHLTARELMNALEHIDGVTRRAHELRQSRTQEAEALLRRTWALLTPLGVLVNEARRRRLVLPQHLRFAM